MSRAAPGTGGRAVECTGLENRQSRKRLVGSNPTPSASSIVVTRWSPMSLVGMQRTTVLVKGVSIMNRVLIVLALSCWCLAAVAAAAEPTTTRRGDTDACIKACNECLRGCRECLVGCDCPSCEKQCLTCLETCRACIALMAYEAPLSGEMCALCAQACANCAAECLQCGDMPCCTRCAEACQRCHATCKAMAG